LVSKRDRVSKDRIIKLIPNLTKEELESLPDIYESATALPKSLAEAGGGYFSATKSIVLQKGRWKPHTLRHELGHYYKGHEGQASPKEFIDHEIEAQLWVYEKTGNPKRAVNFLGGMVTNLLYEYNLKGPSILKLVEGRLKYYKVPRRWILDLEVIKKDL
jgi:hypothetical protein